MNSRCGSSGSSRSLWTMRTVMARPPTDCPSTARTSARVSASSPITAMTKGWPGLGACASGQVTNLRKLATKAALTC